MKRAYADTSEGQVHYATEGSGEPLLLIHESPRSSAAYASIMPLLGKNHRVIAMDTPGYGNSAPPPRPYQMEDYADSVAHFLDSLGIATVDVMGEHTGASIAVELAARWPERVRRLVLDGLPFFPSTEARLARLKQVKGRTLETEEADGSHFTRVWQWALPKAVVGGGKEASQSDLAVVAGYTLDALKAGRQWKEMGMAVFSYDPKARLPLIQAPTLVVSETGESINPYTQLYQEIQGLIPRSSVAIIEGGDSRYNFAAAKELVEKVLSFLETPVP